MQAPYNSTQIGNMIEDAREQVKKVYEHYSSLMGEQNVGAEPDILGRDAEDTPQSQIELLEDLLSERDSIEGAIKATYAEQNNRIKACGERLKKFSSPSMAPKTKPRTEEQRKARNKRRRDATAALNEKKANETK